MPHVQVAGNTECPKPGPGQQRGSRRERRTWASRPEESSGLGRPGSCVASPGSRSPVAEGWGWAPVVYPDKSLLGETVVREGEGERANAGKEIRNELLARGRITLFPSQKSLMNKYPQVGSGSYHMFPGARDLPVHSLAPLDLVPACLPRLAIMAQRRLHSALSHSPPGTQTGPTDCH